MTAVRKSLIATLIVSVVTGADLGDASEISQFSSKTAQTVESIAGPRFCSGTTVLSRRPTDIGAIAVDAAGTVYSDIDPRNQDTEPGLVRIADSLKIDVLHTTVGPGRDPSRSPTLPWAPSASRLATDGKGLFVAAGEKVLEVSKSGLSLDTVAGDAEADVNTVGKRSSGDGKVALEAKFKSARSVALDANGNLYIADMINLKTNAVRIRFVNRSAEPVRFYAGRRHQLEIGPGHIDTIAGRAGSRNSGDGGPALNASINGIPPALAAAPGRVYLALHSPGKNGRAGVTQVRMINVDAGAISAHGVRVEPGEIQKVLEFSRAGEGRYSRIARTLSYVPGIDVDEAGSLYLADHFRNRVLKLDDLGLLTTFAGTAKAGFNGNERKAISARLNRPYDVKIGPGGQIYLSDKGNGQVRVVDLRGIIHAAPGHRLASRCLSRVRGEPQGGRPNPAPDRLRLGRPTALDADPKGNVYFVDSRARLVMKRDHLGRVMPLPETSRRLMVCPGREKCEKNEKRLVARSIRRLHDPAGLLVLPARGLYVLDRSSRKVFFVNLSTRSVGLHGVRVPPGQTRAVVSLTKRPTPSADEVTVPPSSPSNSDETRAAFSGLARDGRGSLYVADPDGRRVVRFDAKGRSSVLAGDGAPDTNRGCCTAPVGLAADPLGNLYISDRQTHQVWLISQDLGESSAQGQTASFGPARPVAGTGHPATEGDGPGLQTPLAEPQGIALDRQGNLYIAVAAPRTGQFAGDSSIRRLDTSGQMSTVAGLGPIGFGGDGLKGPFTALNLPTGLAMDRCENLLISDSGNRRIRRLNSIRSC